MPENESLNPDNRTANRWGRLKERLSCGETPNDIFPDLEIEFYRSMHRGLGQCRNRGVDLSDLLDAAVNDPRALRELVGKTRFHDFAKSLNDVSLCNPGADRENILRGLVNTVWDYGRDQIQFDCHEAAPADFVARVDEMLDRWCRRFIKNPSSIPSCPPRPRGHKPSDIDDTLSMSLLQ